GAHPVRASDARNGTGETTARESSMRCRSAGLAGASAVLRAAPVSGQSDQEGQTGFLDRAVTVAGRTYPYQVYVPREYAAAGERRFPVILFLHGAGERGDDG